MDLPEDQSIFLRGFRVARKFKILPPRLKAAAGPNPDPNARPLMALVDVELEILFLSMLHMHVAEVTG